MSKPVAQLNPAYQSVVRNGVPVIEVSVYGLTKAQWDRIAERFGSMRCVEHISDISGYIYFRSPAAAERFAKIMRDRGLDVTVSQGKIGDGVTCWIYMERVAPGLWK